MEEIIRMIEEYIQRSTRRNSHKLEDALANLESLESDLINIVTDIKECLEGRV
tara:strand:- start:53 stop:211 length:159 start_codon:yes stop_codon:yes gene_type:complete